MSERKERIREHPPPAGTVTLLFSDIEGSTRLLQELGESYPSVLAQHDEIMRRALSRRGGYEFGHEGDAFFAAFTSAGDALRAAVEAQRELAASSWPHGRALRVRIGLHTGAPAVAGDDYVGLDVHRAARISSAAHGGQIIVSQSTRALVQDDPQGGFGFRDLGEHLLRDLDRAERLHQVVAPGLEDEFPPPRGVGAPLRVPAMPTTLVGRERELAEVSAILYRPETRLVTLLGPGGTGKTRLALRLAERSTPRYAGGVFFVELAPVQETALVGSTIARALGLDLSGTHGPVDLLRAHLGDRRVLLVLDNFEHLVDAAALVGELLVSCPGVNVVATSRTALRLSAEHEYHVPPLSLPDPRRTTPELVGDSEAVALFVERARAVKPGFELNAANAPALAQICRRLDGLPLAIELAAARIRLLEPDALLARLDRHLKLLTGGPRDAPARQRTLRGAIEWSYELLAPDEQAYFRRLAPFAGGWALAAAEAVVDPHGELGADALDVLSSLLDKSLVRSRSGDAEPRFSMLRTIRDYALERLEEDPEAESVRDRHARFFTLFAESADDELLGPAGAGWLERLETEHDNLRAALEHAGRKGTPEFLALRLAGALGRFWYTRGYVVEGIRRLDEALEVADGAPDHLRARALHYLGVLLAQRTEHERAVQVLHEELRLQRRLGDPERIAAALNSLGVEAYSTGDLGLATELLEESLSVRRAGGDEKGLATVLSNLGLVALTMGDSGRAEVLLNQALEIDARHGNDWGVGLDLVNLSAAATEADDLARAEALLREAVPILRRLGERDGLAECLERGVGICSRRRQWAEAARLAGAAAAVREEIGAPLVESEARRLERFLDPVRAQLKAEAYDAAWARGRAESLDEALEHLLTAVFESR